MPNINASHNSFDIDLINYTELNGTLFELNVSLNFSKEQIAAFNSKNIPYYYANYTLHYFEDFNNLTTQERTYARYLAFYRRITLPLESTIRQNFPADNYAIESLKNFELFATLFKNYYDNFDKSDNSSKLKTSTYNRFKNYVVRLWMSGYGLIPGLTTNHLTDDVLKHLLDINAQKKLEALPKFCRFISFALSQEQQSPISQVCRVKTVTSLKDREIAKWNKLIKKYPTEITLEFNRFTFDTLYPRTIENTLHEYHNPDGLLMRVTYNKIAPGSFVDYSISLRNACTYLYEKGFYSITDTINTGLFTILTEIVPSFDKTKATTIKMACKLWLEWYIHENNLSYNINKIIPISFKQRPTTYGRVLNYGDMLRLIEALLDDDCPFYKNQSLMDYRCRYISLLMLSSGQRVSEICALPYDCLKTDNRDCTFLVIPKTKTGEGNTVEATPDIIEYVTRLREKAPSLPILFSSQQFKSGDDLTILRLSANKFETGPIQSDTVNNFLLRLQDFLYRDNLAKPQKLSSHDFRRMRAIYMRLLDYSPEKIQEQLGQQNIHSQLPYLQTKPLEHQKSFEQIYKEGIYDQLNDEVVNQISKQTSTLIFTAQNDNTSLVKTLLESIEIADDFEVPNIDTTSLSPIGFPVGLYSCNATTLTTCNSSSIHCFSCDYYKPDENSLIEHSVEVFRYMILNLIHQKMLKSTKNPCIKAVLSDKISKTNDLITEAFDKLFIQFDLGKETPESLKLSLEQKAKKYFKQHKKLISVPSFKEAKKFLEEQ